MDNNILVTLSINLAKVLLIISIFALLYVIFHPIAIDLNVQPVKLSTGSDLHHSVTQPISAKPVTSTTISQAPTVQNSVAATSTSSKSNSINLSQSSSSNSGSQTNLTVNGQHITVPNNGTYNKTITTNGQTTKIMVDNSSSSSGASSNSSVNISSSSNAGGQQSNQVSAINQTYQ